MHNAYLSSVRSLLILALSTLAIACGDSGSGGSAPPPPTNGSGSGTQVQANVQLSTSSATAPADGSTPITATAVVTLANGSVVADGTTVTFTTTLGTFVGFNAATAQTTTTNGSASLAVVSSSAGDALIRAASLGSLGSASVSFLSTSGSGSGGGSGGGSSGGGSTVSFSGTILLLTDKTLVDAGVQNTVSLSGFAKNLNHTPYAETGPVVWTVTGPSSVPPSDWGIISAPSQVANGTFSGTWNAAEQAGRYLLIAWLGSVTDYVFVDVIDRTPATINLALSQSAVDADGASTVDLTVTVLDSSGSPVADGTDVLLTLNGVGSIDNTAIQTSNGIATATYTPPSTNVGSTVTITAAVGALTDTATLTVNPVFAAGPFSGALLLSADPLITDAGASNTVSLSGFAKNPDNTPYDGNENVVWTVTGPTGVSPLDWGIVDPPASVNNGTFTGQWRVAEQTGKYLLIATLGSVTDYVFIDVVDRSPASVVMSASQTVLNADGSSTSNLTITVLDNTGSPVPDGTGVLLTLGGPGVLNDTSLETANGIATAVYTAPSTSTSSVVPITASSGGITDVVSLTVNGVAPPGPFSGTVLLFADSTFVDAGAQNTVSLNGYAKNSDNTPYTGSESVVWTVTGPTGVPASQWGIIDPPTGVNSGAFSGTWNAAEQTGKYLLMAQLGSVTGYVFIDVIDRQPNSVNLTASQTTVRGDGSTATLTIDVLDVLGAPVADGTAVQLTLTGPGSLSPLTVQTSGGSASAVYTAPGNLTIGSTATITATANGQSDTVTITLTPATPFAGTLLLFSDVNLVDAGAQNTVALSGFAKNSDNTPYSGTETVIWTVTGPTGVPAAEWGIIDPPTGVNAGAFSGTWRAAETAGKYLLMAQLGSVTDYVFVDVVDRSPASVAINVDPTAVDGDGSSTANLAITVLDGSGSPVPDGTQVLLTLTGGGTLNPATAQTSNGVATAVYTAPNATVNGSATITATAGGVSDSASITINAVPPFTPFAGTVLLFSDVNLVDAGAQNTVALSGFAKNSDNTPYAGTEMVIWTVTGPTGVPASEWGIVDPPTGVNSGAFSGTWRAAETAGKYLLMAQLGGVTDYVFVDVVDRSPASVAISANPAAVDGDGSSTVDLTVNVLDGSGSPVPDGTQVLLTLTGGGTLNPATAQTTGGVATAVYTAPNTTVSGPVSVTAVAGGVSDTVSITVNGVPPFTPFAGTLLLFSDVDLVDAGAQNTVALSGFAKNSDNTPYAGTETVIWTVTGPSGVPAAEWGIVDPPSDVNNGTFSGTWRAAETAGRYLLMATLGSVTDYVFVDVINRVPASIVVAASTSSLNADGTSTADLTVSVFDSANQPVPDGTQVQFTITSGGGSIAPAVANTQSGIATAVYTAPADTALGTNVIIEASSGTVSDTVGLTLVDVAPASIIVSTDPGSAEVGGSIFVTATVLTSASVPVPSATPVTFYLTPNTTDATLTVLNGNTDEQGRATARINAGSVVGTHQVIACVSACAITDPQVFTITPPNIGSIQFQSASPTQIGVKGSDNGGNAALPEIANVSFLVLTSSGQPAPDGTVVTFSLQAPPGTTLLTPSAQAVGGVATARIRSGAVAGIARVSASVQFGGNQLIASSTAIPIVAGPPMDRHISLVVSAADIIKTGALSTDGLTQSFSFYVGDRFNNPVPDGTTVFFASEAGIMTPSATVGAGVATVQLTTTQPRPMQVTNASANASVDFSSFRLTSTVVATHAWPRVTSAVDNQRVRVAAFVWGEEFFTDNDANGRFEPATDTTFFDLDEPFLDYDSDGRYDAVVTDYAAGFTVAELFWDVVTADGKWSTGNAQYDTDMLLYDSIDVYWTDPGLNFQFLPSQYIDRDGDNVFDPYVDVPLSAVFGSIVTTAADVITNCTGVASVTTEQIITNGLSSPTPTVTASPLLTFATWAGDRVGMWPYNGESVSITADDLSVTPPSYDVRTGSVLTHGLFFAPVLNEPQTGINAFSLITVSYPDNQDFVVRACVIGGN